MPLTSLDPLKTIAEYKKLIQTEARVLTATGSKYHCFAKYIFGDKTTGPLLLFGAIDNSLLATISKNGARLATGQAMVNDADQIVLEPGNAPLDYAGLAKAWKSWGVVRELYIPAGAEQSESSNGGSAGGPAKPAPLAGKPPVGSGQPRPGVTSPGLKPVAAPGGGPIVPPRAGVPPVGRPTGQQGTAPTAAKGSPLNPAAPEGVKTGAAPGGAPPVPPARPPRAGEIPAAPKPVDPRAANPAAAKASSPGGPPPVPSRDTKPGAPAVSPGTQPGAQPPQKPAAPNPAAASPVRGTTPPNQPPPATPPFGPKRIFDDRLKLLRPRYQEALKGPIPGVFKPLFDEMIAKANGGDFPGALVAAGKLDAVLNKVEFAEQKTAKQERRAARLSETFNAVKKSYFKPGSAAILESQNSKGDKQFDAFISGQKAFETARDEKSLNGLEAMAKAWCTHFETDLSPKDQEKADNAKKHSVCQTALKAARHYRLALERDKIGAPPWDEEKEIRASELYSKLLFEQEDDKIARANPSQGASGSWWVEKTDFETDFADIRKAAGPAGAPAPKDPAVPKKQLKTFIFKPTDAEAEIDGFPKGGSAAREVLGKAIGDQLQAATGLNFGVPETALVALDSSRLEDQDGILGSGAPRVGSVQHFTKARGEYSKLKREDPGFLASLPEDEVHKMAVYDLVQLNMDRHGGNFMIGEDGGKPKLVPIDHGLVVPSRTGLAVRRMRLGPPYAALGTLPCANKKFAPELVEKIKQVDANEVVAAMKKAYEAMAKLHPEAAKAAEISEENFKLTKRSIQFLQKASGQLTLAEMQDAYVGSLEEIFDTKDDQMEAGFDAAIRRSKLRGAALKELVPLIDEEKKFADFVLELLTLGWGVDARGTSMDGWITMNPEKVLKIHKSKMENPAARKEINELRSQLTAEERAKLTNLDRLDQQLVTLRNAVEFKNNDRKAATYGIKSNVENGMKMAAYEAAGGDGRWKQPKPDGSEPGFNERFEACAAAEIARLGGDAAVTKIARLYPATPVTSTLQKLRALQAWPEYQRLGGDVESSRLGVSGGNMVLTSRLEEMKCMMQISAVS